MSWLGSAYQKRPDRATHNSDDGFYAHGRVNDQYGLEFGVGAQSDLIGTPEGWHASSELDTAGGFLGNREESDGSYTHGFGLGGRVATINGGYGERGKGNYLDASADAFGADAGAYFNPDQGMGVGVGAYAVQAQVTAGDIGTDHNDSESRFGMGLGVGGGGRLHWDDADNDGYREYGIGMDVGPFSFDVRSEDPVADFIPGMGLVRGLTGSENLTHDIGDGISDAYDWTAGAVGDAADWTTEAAGDAWDWTTDTAGDVWDGATGLAGDAWDGATGLAGDAWDAAGSFFSGW